MAKSDPKLSRIYLRQLHHRPYIQRVRPGALGAQREPELDE
jgi:hypothetical protein